MNLFRKATATVALVTLVSGVFSTGVYASSSTEIEAANALAAKGYINNHSDDTAAYNLNQNVLRQEIAAVARGVAGLDKKSSCDGSFADTSATTPNTWACYSVEALLDAGLIAANDNFRPEAKISKAEAVGMMVKAAFGDEYAYDSNNSASWQEQVVDFAVSKGVVSNFSNYDTAATRGFVFEAGNNAIIASEEVAETCDEVSQLLGLCGEETAEETTEEETTEETVVVSGDNVLTAELSADTPVGGDLPLIAEGVSVLAVDVTAGSEDVSISSVDLKRTGFGAASAVDGAAVFADGERVSKYKTFNSNDEAVLTFSPALNVKAGETTTLVVKVNAEDDTGEFAISLENITASSTVEAATIVSDTFEVKSATAAVLTVLDTDVNATVKAGEEQAELAEFRLTNNTTNNNESVVISSVTLKETGTIDQELNIANLTLSMDGNVISTVASMEGKYVTFNFDPITIAEGKNEKLVVKGDILGGATDTVIFTLDNVVDINATASTYDAVNVTVTDGTFTTVTIAAGELTIYAIDATTDEVRQDKKDVEFGQLKIVNVAGKNLELDNLGVTITIANQTAGHTHADVIENVEFELNGTSYDLTGADTTQTSATIYSESDLDIALPQGTTILTVRGDILDTQTDSTDITLSIADATATAQFKVVETDEDNTVTDLTPSSLTWKKVEVVHTSATVSNVPLADVTVVKGTSDLVALQFEVKAGKPSPVTMSEANVTVLVDDDGTFGAIGASGTVAGDNDVITEVKLYKGSVSDSNLLDKVSGSGLATGVASFDGFQVEIAADSSETFIVTLSTTDIYNASEDQIKVTLDASTITLEDDETDTVSVSGTLSDKVITISDTGSLTLTADSQNTDNTDTKTILSGTDATVFSLDALSTNEDVKVETVVFTASENLKTVAKTAKLYLGDTLVATAANSDVTDATTVAAATIDATTAGDLTVTADVKGTESNGYQVIINSGGADTTGVVVASSTSSAITLTVEDDGAGAADPDWDDIVSAINNDSTASNLVTASTSNGSDTFVTADAETLTLASWVDGSTITFENISNLVIPTTSTELRLAIETDVIGFEKVGSSVSNVEIENVAMSDATGDESGETVTVTDLSTTSSNRFSVVPGLITPSVTASLSSSTTPQITISANTGDNSKAASNDAPVTSVDTIEFSILGTTDADSSLTYSLVNIEDSSDTISGTVSGNTLTFDLAADATFVAAGLDEITNGGSETYKVIVTGATADADTLQLTLLESGITYDVDTTTGITTNLSSEIDFGSRSY